MDPTALLVALYEVLDATFLIHFSALALKRLTSLMSFYALYHIL